MNEPQIPQSPAPPPAGPVDGFKFNPPTIVGLLYCASLVVGITSLIGVVLAYVQKGDHPGSWMESHFTYLIRTFWLGLAGGVICLVLMLTIILIPVAWLGLVGLAVWAIVRSVKSILAAQKEQPIPDPQTLAF
jgi:uncharacterized membrane protein